MWIVIGGLAVIGALFAARMRVSGMPQVALRSLCVTKGSLQSGSVDSPTFRAVALGTSGEAVAINFVYRGRSQQTRALASGQVRRQIGLKLRAANGCNLVYVMWRLDPKPMLEMSIKHNPGARTHAECGAQGYTKLGHAAAPALRSGDQHSMQAAITGDDLLVWIDGQLAWQGTLPAEARSFSGPSGFRSDNLAYDLVGIYAPAGQTGAAVPKCVTDGED